MLLPNQNPFRIVSKYQQFGRDQNFPTPGDVAVGWLLLPQGSSEMSGWPHKMKTGAVWGKSTVVLSGRFWDQSRTLSQIVWWEPQLTVFLPQDLMGYRGFFLTHIIYIIYIIYIYYIYYIYILYIYIILYYIILYIIYIYIILYYIYIYYIYYILYIYYNIYIIYYIYIYIYYMLHISPYGILYMNGWVEGVLVSLLPWNGLGVPHDLTESATLHL